MDDSPRIPVMQQPASLMEAGPNGNNLAAQATARHPVDNLQRSLARRNHTSELEFVRHVYGSGLAMVLATEQKIARQQDQKAVFPGSTNLYRDTVTGNDVQLDFADFLSLPQNRPDFVKHEDPHRVMERQLGM